MNNKIIDFSDEIFEIMISKEKKLILVDFWAEWCNPCKIISNILNEIFDKYSSKIVIGKINIDSNNKVPNQYNIRSIPTLVLFKKKRVIDRHVGVLSKKQLQNFLDKYI